VEGTCVHTEKSVITLCIITTPKGMEGCDCPSSEF
jgi:hypothetical protein